MTHEPDSALLMPASGSQKILPEVDSMAGDAVYVYKNIYFPTDTKCI